MKVPLIAIAALVLSGAEPQALPRAPTGQAVVTQAVMAANLTGLDVHDGMPYQVGATYYLVGTRYGCGFQWGTPNTPWCGFGVWSSRDKVTWAFERLLFDPQGTNNWKSETWQATCGLTGAGCFNPRLVQRGDGVWILWFNAPGDSARFGANAYYAMGCNGPAGPCGDAAGPPYGSTHKPNLWICSGNGDFSLANVAGIAYVACTMPDQTLRIEQLDQWWTNGVNIGLLNVGGLTHVESPAVVGIGGVLYLTYSYPECGYCSGTGTGQLTASQMTGPWTIRALVSARSFQGQPRSVGLWDGQPYEWVDLWQGGAPAPCCGAPNQASAGVHLEPLAADNGVLSAWPGG